MNTRRLHDRVENTVDIPARLSCGRAYRTFLKRLLGLYRPLEEKLSGVDWEKMGIDLSGRRKSAWLEADLADLGCSEQSLATVPVCGRLPNPRSAEEVMGWLYTIEGATLGGRLILREAEARLGVSGAWAGRFFHGYGAATSAMWRQVTSALNAIDARSARAAEIEAAACGMFVLYEQWMTADAVEIRSHTRLLA